MGVVENEVEANRLVEYIIKRRTLGIVRVIY